MIHTLLLFCTFFFFQLGQLGRVSFIHQHINIYIYEIFLCLFLISLFIRYKFQPLIKLWKINVSLFVFLIVLLMSFISKISDFSLLENAVGFSYFIRLIMYLFFGIYTFYYVRKVINIKKVMELCIFILATSIIISSIFQYLFYPDLVNLQYLGWDPHLLRVFGVFFDTSIAGAIYGLFIIFFLVYKFETNIFKGFKNLYLLFFLALLFLTFSRLLILSLLFTLSVFFIRKKKFYFILLLIMLFVGLYFIAPKTWGEGVRLKRTFSIQSRIEDYNTGLNLWTKAPLFGVGYNRIRYERQHLDLSNSMNPSHAGASFHSSLLIVLVSAGLFGFFAFMYMHYSLYTLLLFSQYFIMFVFIASWGDNILLHPFVLFIMSVFISCKAKEGKYPNRL